MIFKIESTDKNNTEQMTATDFPATFSHFKEGSRLINEIKAPEWMDAKVKTKESTFLMIIDRKWQELVTIREKNKPQRSSTY